MDHITAELAFDARCELGEGPVWDWRHDRLLWVDLLAGRLHRQPLGEAPAVPRSWNDTVGSVGLLGDDELVVNAGADVLAFDPRTDVHRRVARVAGAGERINDAGCDPWGRWWLGVMSRTAPSPQSGRLLRDGGDGFTTVMSGIAIPNGLGWSPDRTSCYFVVTDRHQVLRFTLDEGTGEPTSVTTFVQLEPSSVTMDGLCVDADGRVWVALWGAGEVRGFAPDGRHVAVVRVPVSAPTSCTFGGAGLDTLFITSARFGLSVAELDAQPHAGGVFAVDVGCAGQRAGVALLGIDVAAG